MVDVLVLNYNDADTTIEYIKKVQTYECVRKLLIVDNCSTDDSVERLRVYENEKVELLQSTRNGGYGAGNNLGIRYLIEQYNSKYILLSNPDTIIEKPVVETLEQFLENHSDYIIAAPFMYDAKMNKQVNTAFRIPELKEYILSLDEVYSYFKRGFFYKDILTDSSEFKEVGMVSGALFMMDAQKMIKYGMYDEKIFLYCEEMSLGLKLKNTGLKVALLPNEMFVHNHSVSISKSYKTMVSRRKLLVESQLYVIKNYYRANARQMLWAHILAKLSLIETVGISMLKKLLKR